MACITTSSVNPSEGGTAVITLSFLDEDDNVVTPTSLAWQLSDKNGNIITGNGSVIRSFANGSFSGTTVVLQGDDLAIQSAADEGDRYFAVQGEYDSSAGVDLPLHSELKFTICSMINFD